VRALAGAANISEIQRRGAPTEELDGTSNVLVGSEKNLENGLAKLVLTVVELLRQVLERQALRRLEEGDLSEEEVERLGLAFLHLKTRMKELSDHFGVEEKSLAVTLGSLLKSDLPGLDDVSLVEVIDRLIKKGVVLSGKVSISVADIDLVGLDLFAVLYPVSGKTSGRRT
jgi:hypothetical protein